MINIKSRVVTNFAEEHTVTEGPTGDFKMIGNVLLVH